MKIEERKRIAKEEEEKALEIPSEPKKVDNEPLKLFL